MVVLSLLTKRAYSLELFYSQNSNLL